jgi:hypothetical protein
VENTYVLPNGTLKVPPGNENKNDYAEKEMKELFQTVLTQKHFASVANAPMVARFLLVQHTKNYQINIKYTKWPLCMYTQ